MTERDAFVWALGNMGLPLGSSEHVVIECHHDVSEDDPKKDVVFKFDETGTFYEVEVVTNHD